MIVNKTYVDYVNDQQFMDGYAAYQEKYAKNIRESDRVLIDLIQQRTTDSDRSPRLIDIGCSTGNLLLHLKHALPSFELCGGEMPESILKSNRENPDLEGMSFQYVDALNFDEKSTWDFVVANAVFFLFSPEDYKKAIANCLGALRPGGHLILFDFYHPYAQELSIFEKSATHPEGMVLHFRPFDQTARILDECGFDEVKFHPFQIPIDLESKEDPSDLTSRTVRSEDGRRLLFRGTLFQPWCHLTARKPEDGQR